MSEFFEHDYMVGHGFYRDRSVVLPEGIVFVDFGMTSHTALSTVVGGRMYHRVYEKKYSGRYSVRLARKFLRYLQEAQTPEVET